MKKWNDWTECLKRNQGNKTESLTGRKETVGYSLSHKSATIGVHGLTSWIANLVDSDNDQWTSNLEPNSTYSTTWAESPSLNHTCDISTCMLAIVDICCNQENSCIRQITSKLHKRRYYQPMECSRATEDGQALCIEDIRRIMHGCISSGWFLSTLHLNTMQSSGTSSLVKHPCAL